MLPKRRPGKGRLWRPRPIHASGKPVRSERHPVKVVFQCAAGYASKHMAEQFNAFLKAKGFGQIVTGMPHKSPPSGQKVYADMWVSFAGVIEIERIKSLVVLPEGIKPRFLYDERFKAMVVEEERLKLFEEMLEEIKNKFELRP